MQQFGKTHTTQHTTNSQQIVGPTNLLAQHVGICCTTVVVVSSLSDTHFDFLIYIWNIHQIIFWTYQTMFNQLFRMSK